MNTRNNQIIRHRYIENPEVSKLLNEKKNAKAAIELAIAGIGETISKFKAEEQKINEIAARFGAFLKRHAIMPYNDSFEAYVEMAIRDAESDAEKTKDNRKLDGLKVIFKKNLKNE